MSARSPQAPRPQAVGCLGMEELRFRRAEDPRQRPTRQRTKHQKNKEIFLQPQGVGGYCTKSKSCALLRTSLVADRRSAVAASRPTDRQRLAASVYISGRWPTAALKPARPACTAVNRRGSVRSAPRGKRLSGRKRSRGPSRPRKTRGCSL